MGGVAEVSQEPDIEATQPAGRDHQIVSNSTEQPKIAVPSQSLKNGPRWGVVSCRVCWTAARVVMVCCGGPHGSEKVGA